MKKILALLFLVFVGVVQADFRKMSSDAIAEDFKNGTTEKYRTDDLPLLSDTALVERKIISNIAELTRSTPAGDVDKSFIRKNITCSFVQKGFTAAVYNVDFERGVVTCMLAPVGDIYNPLGLFTTVYPDLKKKFTKDLKKAEADNKASIKSAGDQFAPLEAKLKEISKSTVNNQNGKYLTIPQILTAAILTDTDVIDLQKTKETSKLQLKDGFTSKYLSSDGSGSSDFIDNKEYILLDAKTIFDVYSGLGDVSMIYLVYLIAGFGLWGARLIIAPMATKMEDKQNHEKMTPFITGIIGGILLFFPSGVEDQIKGSDGSSVGGYTVLKTEYQNWEKIGYGFFTDWADDAAKVIIDAEMRAIVDKSGVGSKSQIIESAAGYQQYSDLTTAMTNVKEICRDDIYNYGSLSGGGNTKDMPYSSNGNSAFPVSEKWAYVSSIVNSKAIRNYYGSSGEGEVKDGGSYNGSVAGKIDSEHTINDFYPEFSMSACGKAWFQVDNFSGMKDDYYAAFKKASTSAGADNTNKIAMLKGIIEFQYGLKRDWGYLSVLGLPVTKMQTEYIGGLYKSGRSEVLEKLNKEISKDSYFGLTHTLMSSIPYMFVPGASTAFQISMNMAKGVKEAVNSTIVGQVGKLIGTGVAASVAGSIAGLSMGLAIAKIALGVVPIVGIMIIGLVRFIVIMVKIFSLHFVSLFLMPLALARENVQAMSKFTMKIFATMLELPIFVLSVWLAITANSLIHTIGDVFGKQVILGMLKNSELQYANSSFDILDNAFLSKLKIYVFDGFIEIAISAFSIVIIYKLLVSLHNTFFEVLEVQGSRELDDAVESMKNESSNWGNKI
ncbi:MAG: hypothetical protein Q7S59_03170 [Sulfurimonas sp.]|nr:hypothetical protein [Sulfurimonas sp.]